MPHRTERQLVADDIQDRFFCWKNLNPQFQGLPWNLVHFWHFKGPNDNFSYFQLASLLIMSQQLPFTICRHKQALVQAQILSQINSYSVESHERSCLEKQKRRKETKEFAKLAMRAVDVQQKEQHKMRHRKAAGLSAISQTLLGQPGGVHLDYYEGDHGDYDALSVKGAHQRSDSDTSIKSIAGLAPENGPPPVVPHPDLDKFKMEYHPNNGHAKFTFKTHGDVSKAWDKASMQMTLFEKHVISVEYQKGKLDFDIYSQPLWDWAMDLLNHWWRIQSSLPNKGVPFALILYADKMHLSSSGNVKGYPVIAQCVNLLVHIQNCAGIGGGCLVGLLLIVSEDSEQSNKLSYTNLKCIVWHEAFLKFLEVIILYSKTGFAHQCFNDIPRWLYALILLLSANYKEQCVMALIHETGSLCPCPICLVPSMKICNHMVTYPIQKVEDAQIHVKLYEENHIAGEVALKKQEYLLESGELKSP
ncbi:uncharacterized protein EDB93DRAFT_1103812 [Suillus bovinus]|uniref:uncharacterized protein n=1 Tax=Suillus bovinus TaxID=48563 RepID=UPI001B86CCD4|nr:uncharacterized protein EDB93DRAFT_1103812 [Suillus bovinus]KAG2148143.1 hypothetical protein EDB93DRAFT_1103812 [Suillus bovinus]